MVRGAKYKLIFLPKNKATGELITDTDLVDDIELVLFHSGSANAVKKYNKSNGVEAMGDGRYTLTISDADTLLLPLVGKAFLQGFILPIKKSIKLDLGNITDNKSNYEVPNE